MSRGTVRRALDNLEREGLIVRSAGKPTRINTPKIPLLSSGFRTDIAKKGMTPDTEVLAIGPVKAPHDVAALLSVAENAPVLAIERVITADQVPIIIETAHIARVTDPISVQDVKTRSLLELIPAKCQVYLTRAVESYEPVRLGVEHARRLQCHPGDLAIKDQAVLFDRENVPLYVSTALVRGDKARILTETVFDVHR